MRVVITGARHGHPSVDRWMHAFVAKHGVPELFIIGCALGVDQRARFLCRVYRWSHVIVYADEALPSPERFRERNQRMVDLAHVGDWCLAFPRPESRGTWDCVLRAKQRGLQVAVCKTFEVG